jgi:hypothetical protein
LKVTGALRWLLSHRLTISQELVMTNGITDITFWPAAQHLNLTGKFLFAKKIIAVKILNEFASGML